MKTRFENKHFLNSNKIRIKASKLGQQGQKTTWTEGVNTTIN